jgi:hypothetical protein
MGGSERGGASTRVGELLQRIAAFSFAAFASSAFAAEAGDSEILYFEPLRLSAPSTTQQKSTQSRELRFDAYGRRFVVSLQTNEKLSPLLQSKTGVAALELYKGQINGVAGSWARIAIADGKPRGMLWDGSELYIIEPVATLSDSLPVNIPVSADTTAIFRLDDVLMKSGATSCGTDADAVEIDKGSETYGSLLNELKSAPAIMQAAGASRRLEISALGDMPFMNRYGTEAQARAEILLRLNNVDGIFSHQLGVEIQVPSVDIGDSLSATTSASSLLDELGAMRKRSPNLYSRGLTHLFTGRNLDGTTVGIAYLDSLCNRQYGSGLTEASNRSSWTESLIAAHEIGHGFGAPHDGEANKACASAPTGQTLMSPSINGSDDFSDCSLQVMQPRVATASCVTALPAADITVESDFGTLQQSVGRSFDWNLTVSNIGGLTTTNARAEIVLPPVIAVQEAFVIGGSCITGAGTITCQLGEIAGGSATAINLILRSDVVGTNDVAVRVSAGNESQIANNNGTATIAVEAEADLAIGLQAPASVTNGTAFNVSLVANNLSATAVRGISVTLALPAGVTASAASLNGASCTIQSAAITCSVDSLASGTALTGTATLVASTDGSAQLEARIAGGYVDPVAGNDTASAAVSVTASAATTSQSTSSSGGGGSTGWPLLWALLALVGMKNFQRRAAR